VTITNLYTSFVIIACLLYVIILGLYTSRKVAGDNSLYFYAPGSSSAKSLAFSFFTLNFPGEYFLIAVLFSISFCCAGISYQWIALGVISFGIYYFPPQLLKNKLKTVFESVDVLFSKNEKLILSSIIIVTGIIFRLALILVTAGVLFSDLLGAGYTTFILLMILAAGIYSVTGGLVSIFKLQLTQIVFIIITFFLITTLISGEEFVKLVSNGSAVPRDNGISNSLLQMHWGEVLFFIPVFCIWSWYSEFSLARSISPQNVNTMIKGLAFSRVLKLILLIVFIIIGLIARYYSPDETFNGLLSSFVNSHNINLYIRIIALFTFFSAFVLILSSVFISASVKVRKDFLEPFFGINSGSKLMLINRFFISILVLTTIFIVPVTDLKNVHLYFTVLRYQVLFLSPVAALFIILLLNRHLGSRDVLPGLLAGELIVTASVIMAALPEQNSNHFISWYLSVPVLRLSAVIFVISALTMLSAGRVKLFAQTGINHLFKKV